MHLTRIAIYIGIFLWLAFVYGGVELISRPETGKHSHVGGWILLALCAALMLSTMTCWVRHLQLVIGGFVIGAIFTATIGHLPGNDGSPFSRAMAFGLILILICCSLVVRTIANRRLGTFDRVALTGFLAAIIAGLAKQTDSAGLIGFGTGLGFLCLAWLYDRNKASEAEET